MVLHYPPLPPFHQTPQGLAELGAGVLEVDKALLEMHDFINLIARAFDVLVKHVDVDSAFAFHTNRNSREELVNITMSLWVHKDM
jgi:hypothetical protein